MGVVTEACNVSLHQTQTAAMSHHHGFHHGFLDFPQAPDDDDDDPRDTRARPGPSAAVDAALQPPDPPIYDPSTAGPGILSDMFTFTAGGHSATQLLASQISGGWYGAPAPTHAELFLMNPPQPPASIPRGFGQGLSLSLSSSLQQLDPTKHEDLYYTQQPFPTEAEAVAAAAAAGSQLSQSQPVQAAAASLRQSKYARAAQELLEEFCSVGRGQWKRTRRSSNPNPSGLAGESGGASSSGAKDPVAPPLAAADRFEHQRKKSKLSSMLDEVDRRYNHYCDQMQMVVNSFDSVMGYGAAAPYTMLARKAMSRHFRCLKDSIVAQLRRTCEALGERESAAVTGITKGETPRLRALDQSLRQQRAFNQMGIIEQEAWRPQRGLPERSVSILRAWLFEHFLHPYPNDADKHMLARQTGLSRNQVTNWFINARVRLWKPMVEDMYQQEAKDEGEKERGEGSNQGGSSQSPRVDQYPQVDRTETNIRDNELSSSLVRQMQPQQQQQQQQQQRFPSSSSVQPSFGGGTDFVSTIPGVELPMEFLGMDGSVLANFGARMMAPGTQVRYGATGDVSLTLGLRHAGNVQDNSHFSLGDFGGAGGSGL